MIKFINIEDGLIKLTKEQFTELVKDIRQDVYDEMLLEDYLDNDTEINGFFKQFEINKEIQLEDAYKEGYSEGYTDAVDDLAQDC